MQVTDLRSPNWQLTWVHQTTDSPTVRLTFF